MLVYRLCKDICNFELGQKLGDGADGEVFEYQNHIIKFSILFDTSKYDSIKNSIEYLINKPFPCYVNIFNFNFLKSFKKEFDDEECLIYSYEMEKLNKITDDEKRVFDFLVSHEDRNIVKNYDSAQCKKILAGHRSALDFDAERIMFFLDALKIAPVKHLDIHTRNIMKDDLGNFKLTDMDRSILDTTVLKYNGEK